MTKQTLQVCLSEKMATDIDKLAKLRDCSISCEIRKAVEVYLYQIRKDLPQIGEFLDKEKADE